MSAVTALLPFRTAYSAGRLICMRRAASATDSLTCSSRISRISSPGCVGSRCLPLVMYSAIVLSCAASMVILKVDLFGVRLFPLECDAPWSVYVEGVANGLAHQLVKVEPRLCQVFQRHGVFQRIKP